MKPPKRDKPKPSFLVLAGVGINCEEESARALERSGIGARIVHVGEITERPSLLFSYQGLFLPGGFSYGDDLGAGRVLALTLEHFLGDTLSSFVAKGKAILGVCNGLQVLATLGLVPGGGQRAISLLPNVGGRFINKWVNLTLRAQGGPWFNRFPTEDIRLPVRHGEGRMVKAQEYPLEMWRARQALAYVEDINGSFEQAAAVCDETGLILGMMPHPEAAVDGRITPPGESAQAYQDGRFFFESIRHYLAQS